MSSRGTTGNTRVQSPLSVTTATGVSPGLTILLSIWRDISKQNKTKFKTNKSNQQQEQNTAKARVATAAANDRRKCREAEGWTSGGEHGLAEESSHLQTSVYIRVHAHVHAPLTHRHTHTYPLSCTPRYLKYIRLFLMPCPSQMVGAEEEGSLANSASTGCWRQHYWITSRCCQWKNKANGCLHGGRQSERLT